MSFVLSIDSCSSPTLYNLFSTKSEITDEKKCISDLQSQLSKTQFFLMFQNRTILLETMM